MKRIPRWLQLKPPAEKIIDTTRLIVDLINSSSNPEQLLSIIGAHTIETLNIALEQIITFLELMNARIETCFFKIYMLYPKASTDKVRAAISPLLDRTTDLGKTGLQREYPELFLLVSEIRGLDPLVDQYILVGTEIVKHLPRSDAQSSASSGPC